MVAADAAAAFEEEAAGGAAAAALEADDAAAAPLRESDMAMRGNDDDGEKESEGEATTDRTQAHTKASGSRGRGGRRPLSTQPFARFVLQTQHAMQTNGQTLFIFVWKTRMQTWSIVEGVLGVETVNDELARFCMLATVASALCLSCCSTRVAPVRTQHCTAAVAALVGMCADSVADQSLFRRCSASPLLAFAASATPLSPASLLPACRLRRRLLHPLLLAAVIARTCRSSCAALDSTSIESINSSNRSERERMESYGRDSKATECAVARRKMESEGLI